MSDPISRICIRSESVWTNFSSSSTKRILILLFELSPGGSAWFFSANPFNHVKALQETAGNALARLDSAERVMRSLSGLSAYEAQILYRLFRSGEATIFHF